MRIIRVVSLYVFILIINCILVFENGNCMNGTVEILANETQGTFMQMSALDNSWGSSIQNAETEGPLWVGGKPELHCEKKEE